MSNKRIAYLVIIVLVLVNVCVACNTAPIAVVELAHNIPDSFNLIGKTVKFDASSSNDPDGDIIGYEWDFSYDGHTFHAAGAPYNTDVVSYKLLEELNGVQQRGYTVAVRVEDDYHTKTIATIIINSKTDEDGDYLPDEWELTYFTGSNVDIYSQDGDDNSDGDYIGSSKYPCNNLCEYLHGTNPANASSIPGHNDHTTITVPDDVATIQGAIEVAINATYDSATQTSDRDTIIVKKGIYEEDISFFNEYGDTYYSKNKNLFLVSEDPNNWKTVSETIIIGKVLYEYRSWLNPVDANSEVRGFTLRDEDTITNTVLTCNGGSPVISNCVFKGDASGTQRAIHFKNDENVTSVEPIVKNCFIADFTHNSTGAGIYCEKSSLKIINSVFTNNRSTYNNFQYGCGAAIHVGDSEVEIYNSTFYGNEVVKNGGAIGSGNSDADVICYNCVFAGNSAGDGLYGDDVHAEYGDIELNYCCTVGTGDDYISWYENEIYNNYPVTSDPFFVNPDNPAGLDGIWGTLDDGLRFLSNSSCVDAGYSNTSPTDVGSVDILGKSRFYDGDENTSETVDIGAYEYPGIIVVDDSAGGTGDGETWANAYAYLQDAIDNSDSGNEIWVAQGTYYPDDGDSVTENSRSESFELLEDVAVLGGFAGSGATNPNDRNWADYETILSGNIGTTGVNTDNSYHVVKGEDYAFLDGFTISDGKNDSSAGTGNYRGAGMYNDGDSPVISNCTFTDNESYRDGGAMYNTNSSSPTITNCVFEDNDALIGAAISNDESSPTIMNCKFESNTATDTGTLACGGAILNCDSSPLIVNSFFVGNSNTGSNGGAIGNSDGSSEIRNCVFYNNSAAKYGGAIFNLSGTSALLVSCTFAENIVGAGYDGLGVYNYDGSTSVINSSILWNDSTTTKKQIKNDATSDSVVSFSDVQDCLDANLDWDSNFGFDAGGNIDSEPDFYSTDVDGTDNELGTFDDGLCIELSSDAVDAADSYNAPLKDICGFLRKGQGPDMGAYEVSDLLSDIKSHKVHFSGLFINDEYNSDHYSIAFESDDESDILDVGDYVNFSYIYDTTQATLDSIIIPPYTKLTIYPQPNYTGTPLVITGPAIVYNMTYENTSFAFIIDKIFDNPVLQQLFPSETRVWSDSNMINWNGSFKIEIDE